LYVIKFVGELATVWFFP